MGCVSAPNWTPNGAGTAEDYPTTRLMGCPLMSDGWRDPGSYPAEAWDRALPNEKQIADAVNSPSHYTGFSNDAEVIDITENLNFNRGSAIKYLARAGAKDPAKEIEDLEKAAWYVHREIKRLGG